MDGGLARVAASVCGPRGPSPSHATGRWLAMRPVFRAARPRPVAAGGCRLWWRRRMRKRIR